MSERRDWKANGIPAKQPEPSPEPEPQPEQDEEEPGLD